MGGICCTSDPATLYYHDFVKALPSQKGKRIAITGTTSGTGFFAAMTCAQKGADLFVLNRDSARVEASLSQIRQAVPGVRIEQISCDLQDFASVRKAAEELNAKCGDEGLDVLSCNAGIMAFPNKATTDGFDVQMQTNQLSHFLLAKELFPALRKASDLQGEARIIVHSSSARKGVPLEAKYFGPNGPHLGPDSYSGGARPRYHQTKLANAVFAYSLQSKLEAAGLSKIKAVCAAPGASVTSLWQSAETMPSLTTCLTSCFMQSAEDGTMPLLHAMIASDVKSADFAMPSQGRGGETKGPVKIVKPADIEKECSDPGAQAILWAECEKAIGEPFNI